MSSPTKNNLNKEICDMLKELGEYELTVNKNQFKSRAYKQAAATLAGQDKKIKSGDEAKKLKGIGEKIAKKIDEYLETGSLKKLETIHKDVNAETMMLISKVHGIGPTKAHELVEKHGITSIEQLRERQEDLLNHQQRIGLEHFEDFEKPIPREEIEKVEKLVKEQAAELLPEMEVTICGSYRRSKPESGDIDILVTEPSYVSTCKKKEGGQLLHDFIEMLKKIHLVTETISIGESKFMGVINVERVEHPKGKGGTFRRLDVRVVPHDQYHCMVLHFTGSSLFNQNMRQHAHTKGYTLNEYSLRPINTAGTPGAPVLIKTERDIFDYIDFPYKAPEDRDN